MEQKKTISELYQECKIKQEMEHVKVERELLDRHIADALLTRTPPIPPIPQSFQGKL